jgi:CBS domain-containing protein
MRAADLMTSEVATVTPETGIEALCDLFQKRRITGAPVVDDQGRLVGIVSKDDVIFRGRGSVGGPRQETDIKGLFSSGFVGFTSPGGAAGATVADIMTREVLSAPEDASIEELCRLMWEKRVHRIPIVRGALLVGIVSALDICKGIVNGKVRHPA